MYLFAITKGSFVIKWHHMTILQLNCKSYPSAQLIRSAGGNCKGKVDKAAHTHTHTHVTRQLCKGPSVTIRLVKFPTRS